jgi:hypothetical protein
MHTILSKITLSIIAVMFVSPSSVVASREVNPEKSDSSKLCHYALQSDAHHDYAQSASSELQLRSSPVGFTLSQSECDDGCKKVDACVKEAKGKKDWKTCAKEVGLPKKCTCSGVAR